MSPFARFKDEIADGYVLGPVRVALGTLLGWQALAASEEVAHAGYFGDAFHLAMIPEAIVPSARLYAVLLALRVVLAVMVMFGIWPRPALVGSALLGVWTLLSDRLQFDPVRYSLDCYAFLVALTPCDRSWRATESAVPEPRTGPFWAVRLCQLQLSIVYLASGGSKLLDPDWRSGLVLGDRLLHRVSEDTASSLAKLIIMSELVVCVALWLRPTRVVALWWGVWFHALLALSIRSERHVMFALITLGMYGVFATPDHNARTLRYDPSRFWGKSAGALVPLLDWLGRFEVKAWEPDDQPGHSVVVVRRDGERVTGIRAFAMLTRCLPLLFPAWALVALVASFTRQGDLSSAS